MTDTFAGDGSKKTARLQSYGSQIVSTLYMLVRSVRIHPPDNEIFLKPIEQLRASMNIVISGEGTLDLQAAETNVYLNQTRLKFDFGALENVAQLTREFQKRDIGGFSTSRPVTTQEIRDFLHMFSSDYAGGAANEDGSEGHELPSMRIARYAAVKEVLDKIQDNVDLDQQIDRKKYSLTVYARAVFFMRRYFDDLAAGLSPPPDSKAARLVQDIVDLCADQSTHFLGLTTTKSETEYLPYHAVNTTLMAIVFGAELGLDRRQLHDLGVTALFSHVGVLDVPEELLLRQGGLTASERALVDLYPLRSAKRILTQRGLNLATMGRIVATYESKVDYAVPRRDESGEVQLVMPKVNLGVFGKVIAIADCYDALTSRRPFREAYGPEIALALMASDMKYRFDPVLLRIFMKVMAIQPIKILDQDAATIRMG